MGKDKTQTQTTSLDPRSQGHINTMRHMGQDAAFDILGNPGSYFLGPGGQTPAEMAARFMNPYTQSVIGNLGTEFDRLRQQATVGANQSATQAGAFNSSRHGVLEAERLGALDRAQMQQVGGLLSNQFNTAMQQGLQYSEYERALRERQLQEPIFRNQVAQQLMGGSLGPTGSTSTVTTPGNFWGDLAGVGLMVGGTLLGGPAGGMAASGLMGGAMPTFGGAPGGGAVNPLLGSVFYPNTKGPFMRGLPPISRPAGY